MPYTVEWAVEPIIRLVRLIGVVTPEDVEAWLGGELALNATQAATNGQVSTVHVIVDLTDLKRFNAPLTKMPIVFESMRQSNTGWFAIIGTTPLISFLMEMLHRMAGLRYKLFLDVPEAVAFLTTLERLAQESKGMDSA